MGDFEDDNEGEHTIIDDPLNRRSEPRFEKEIEVRYTSLDDFVVAYTEDISRGGVFVKTKSFLPTGSTVRLDLVLPGDQSRFQVIARVAYLLDEANARKKGREPGMGMEFLDAGGDLISQLEAFVALNFGSDNVNAAEVRASALVVGSGLPHWVDGLRSAGHQVTTAHTGMEALGLILSGPFDLVIARGSMPIMDGWQLLRLVRQRPTVAHLVFALATSGANAEDKVRAFQLGVDDVVDPALSGRDIVIRVAQWITRARKNQGGSVQRSALRGSLNDIALPSVLSFVEVERRTGKMLVVGSDTMATLFIRDGQVIDVDCPDASDIPGIEKLYRVLNWQDGHFELTTCEVDREATIEVPTSFAILEHARRCDEGL